MARETVFIGFGSNVGNRLDYCERAVTLLNLLPGALMTGRSASYETEPVDDGSAPGPDWFINGVVRLETDLHPLRLLEVCQEIERALGRDFDHRHGPRTLDLDILFYGRHRLNQDGFVVPHPRLHLRRFVLAPLLELAPDWIHPVLNRTVRDLLDHLIDPARVKRLDPTSFSIGSTPTYSGPATSN
jgi:2-amino-4-hydroxy-6-hydroxymethyldihydropteridine diphosphokinase